MSPLKTLMSLLMTVLVYGTNELIHMEAVADVQRRRKTYCRRLEGLSPRRRCAGDGQSSGSKADDSCKTVDEDKGGTVGGECVFPFQYGQDTYNECSEIGGPHGRWGWCSLDAVYDGRWGSCPEEGTCRAKEEPACEPFSEDACRLAATFDGLELGGAGYDFVGAYGTKGCYGYKKSSSSTYAGTAYFSTGGTDAQKGATLDYPKYRPAGHDCVGGPFGGAEEEESGDESGDGTAAQAEYNHWGNDDDGWAWAVQYFIWTSGPNDP